jgi:hypothetical protein
MIAKQCLMQELAASAIARKARRKPGIARHRAVPTAAAIGAVLRSSTLRVILSDSRVRGAALELTDAGTQAGSEQG